ncbi:hypothetical protein HPB47_020500 [Ixodes persulcatus]|uniref:Uncharacterized protein n=1 Tax=Ixodes persulcatus TaxID=34615 RepID=A0AC60QG63_IXOPE|nr:hypothetical protein HPB47_020500 [Ixodes persulcatus]
MAEAGHPAGEGSPSIEMELDGQAERPSLGMSSTSSTVTYYESISDELEANLSPFQLVQNRKRRKASTSSESSDKTIKTMNRTDLHLTAIDKPKDPDKVIATINTKKIQEKLDMAAPDGVILVRPNRRLNVLAIYTRNRDATKVLLALTTLDGIAVLAYEPLPRESAAGVIYEVPADLTEVELQLAVRTTAPVIFIRRLDGNNSDPKASGTEWDAFVLYAFFGMFLVLPMLLCGAIAYYTGRWTLPRPEDISFSVADTEEPLTLGDNERRPMLRTTALPCQPRRPKDDRDEDASQSSGGSEPDNARETVL